MLDNHDLAMGLDELALHAGAYEKAAKYYHGSIAEYFTSERARRLLKAAGDVSLSFNFAKTPVNAVSDRLEIAGITGTSDENTALVRQVWVENSLDLEAPGIMRKGCEYGDAYLIVWPRLDDGDAVVGVDMWYNSPLTTRIVYDPERPNVPMFAIKKWSEYDADHKEYFRVDLYYGDRIECYVTEPGRDGSEPSDFIEFIEEEDEEWPKENPYGQLPVFHFRTDRPYGEPLHKGFYGPQDAINKLIVSHLGSVDFAALPQRWATLMENVGTDEMGGDDTGFDPDFDEDDEGSRGVNGADGGSQFKADPGSMWLMRNVKAVGEFAAAQPAVFTDPMAVYLRAGAQITNTPLHYFDPTGDAPSGESLRTAEAPFIKMVKYIMLSFGSTWRQAFEFALRLLGVEDVVQVQWAPPQSANDSEFWEVAEKKIAAGVPQRQILIEAGYTAEQVDAWLAPTTAGDEKNG